LVPCAVNDGRLELAEYHQRFFRNASDARLAAVRTDMRSTTDIKKLADPATAKLRVEYPECGRFRMVDNFRKLARHEMCLGGQSSHLLSALLLACLSRRGPDRGPYVFSPGEIPTAVSRSLAGKRRNPRRGMRVTHSRQGRRMALTDAQPSAKVEIASGRTFLAFRARAR